VANYFGYFSGLPASLWRVCPGSVLSLNHPLESSKGKVLCASCFRHNEAAAEKSNENLSFHTDNVKNKEVRYTELTCPLPVN